MKYQIKVPNPLYNGYTNGVQFDKGIGFTEDKAVRDVLVSDFGYEDVTEHKPKAEHKAEDKGDRKASGK